MSGCATLQENHQPSHRRTHPTPFGCAVAEDPSTLEHCASNCQDRVTEPSHLGFSAAVRWMVKRLQSARKRSSPLGDPERTGAGMDAAVVTQQFALAPYADTDWYSMGGPQCHLARAQSVAFHSCRRRWTASARGSVKEGCELGARTSCSARWGARGGAHTLVVREEKGSVGGKTREMESEKRSSMKEEGPRLQR